MKYIAHKDESGREQTVKEHLNNVAQLSSAFSDVFGEAEMGQLIGLYHDIGKYSHDFQRYIRLPEEKQIRGSVDHSTAGTQYVLQQPGKSLDANLEKMAAGFAIAGHHGGIPDQGTKIDNDGKKLVVRLKRQISSDFKEGMKSDALPVLTFPDTTINIHYLSDLFRKNASVSDREFSFMAYVRMLYSCLVDADYLDTESFMKDGQVNRGRFEPLSKLRDRVDAYIEPFFSPKNSLAVKRTEILKECIAAGDSAEHSLYQLTVPTGGGKTISSLAFAMHYAMAVQPKRQRIIYVIPYTSIIEQTADVFRRIVGENQVIEHHHQVSWDDVNEEDSPKRLATENWDAPLIVTTNVQFFESLFSNRSSKCRKLHNIANSIIIFDEAQMIPIGFLKACMEIIRELTDRYHCTAVFCTATQPSLGEFFPEDRKPVEIVSHQEENYLTFRRCKISMMQETWDMSKLIDELGKQEQCLCIVNRKKTANQLYDRLPSEGRYYLTTNLYPNHRREVLKKIRQRLKEGKRCRVISTSLVEAGVDFSFPMVYREMAGLDNIIQSAGRCNREHERHPEDSRTVVFRLEEESKLPAYITQQACEAAIVAAKYGNDIDLPDAIHEYFQGIHQIKNLDTAGIFGLLENGHEPFIEVADRFKLIKDDTISVFIPQAWDTEEVDMLRDLSERIRNGYASRQDMRKAGSYTVSIYPDKYKSLLDAGKLVQVADDYAVLIDLSVYDKEKGLLPGFVEGMGIFV